MIKSVTRTLWQWSVGRFVKIIPPEGITVDEVHFYNGTTENALIGVHKADGDAIISEIPNILLQSSNNLTVYAMMTDSTGETTVECTTFGVRKRPKPDDYVYSETEVKSWYNLVSRVDELEKASEERYEQIKSAVDEYLLNYADQINKNKQDIEHLHRDKLSSEHLGQYIEDALYNAKETGMFDGKDGKPGEPGVTPHIGPNGNWWIGDTDTCVRAAPEDSAEDDFSLNMEGASIGQTVRVAAVDEAGKPTAWEAADFPDTYNKSEINAIIGSYITDIDTLIGGDT